MKLAFLIWLATTFPWVPQLQVRQASVGKLFRHTYYSCSNHGTLMVSKERGQITLYCEGHHER